MQRREWALLALAAAEGEPLTPVQLQKSLFLLGRELPKTVGKGFYKFRPYNYGPFDPAVYSDAESLESEGLARIRTSSTGGGREYSATSAGLAKARHITGGLPPSTRDYVVSVVQWVRSLSFKDLVAAIYRKYPEFRVNSVFAG